MNCKAENYKTYTVENYKTYAVPVLAGNLRFILGVLLIFAGFYIATLSEIPGHALGLLLVLGAPFMILKDDK